MEAYEKEFPNQLKNQQEDLYAVYSQSGEAFALASSFPFTLETKVFPLFEC